MKVLITGRCIPQQPDRSTGQQLANGFTQAGHDCVFYGNFYGQPHNWLGVEEATTQRFDLVVITEMNDGQAQYKLNTLNLKDTPKIYWDFDISYNHQFGYQRAKFYNPDGFLVGNRYFCGPDGFGRFQKPVLHLPYACSSAIHRRLLNIERKYLISFIGSLTEERRRLTDNIRKILYKPERLNVAEGIFGEDLVRATNQTLIMFHRNQDACRGLVPGRPWESAGCGATLLMDKVSYDDFASLLPDYLSHNLYHYLDDKDMLAKIKHLEDKEAELAIHGRELMEFVHKNHSYKNRAETIIEWSKTNNIL